MSIASKTPMDCMKVQAQIRANATEMQDYYSELSQWEKAMEKKDREVRGKRKGAQALPVRPSCGTVGVATSAGAAPGTTGGAAKPVAVSSKSKKSKPPGTKKGPKGQTGTTAASHTYDKGYKKWEAFDVDAALAQSSSDESEGEAEAEVQEVEQEVEQSVAPTQLTPATITAGADRVRVDRAKVVKPRPRALPDADMELAEREKGNEHYRKGEWAQALQCYTRCIAINSKSVSALSNRSMAYLKLKEWGKAEQDASRALHLDPIHIKSWQRRASARVSLGKVRAALLDLHHALALHQGPPPRDLQVELRKAKEQFRSSLKRCPSLSLPITLVPSVPLPPSSPQDPTPVPAPPPVAPIEQAPVETLPSPPTPVATQPDPPKQTRPYDDIPPPPCPPPSSSPLPPTPSPAASPVPPSPKPPSIRKPSRVSSLATVCPKTPHDLTRAWRSLGSITTSRPKAPTDMKEEEECVVTQRRSKYLADVVTPAGLSQVCKKGRVEPDVLAEVIASLEKGQGREGQWVQAIAGSGPMALMLLPKEAQEGLRRMVGRVGEGREQLWAKLGLGGGCED